MSRRKEDVPREALSPGWDTAATATAPWAVLFMPEPGRNNPSSGTRYHKYQEGNRDTCTRSVLKQILNPAKEQGIGHHFFSASMIDCPILRIVSGKLSNTP